MIRISKAGFLALVASAALSIPGFASQCGTGPWFPGPGIVATGNPSSTVAVCAGNPVTLTVTASDMDSIGDPTTCPDTIASYTWTGAVTGTGSQKTVTFQNPGMYTVTCTVNDTGYPADDDPVDVVFHIDVMPRTTYSPGPAIVAEIASDNVNPAPGEVVELHVTDGDDFLPYDKDNQLECGTLTGTVDDDLTLAKWSVSGGTLDIAQTTDWLHGFRAHWTAPTTPGRYTVTLKVYDAGKYVAPSLDSADPTPYTRTKSFDVGTVTYSSAPAIAAAIQASAITPPPGYMKFQLTATNGAGGAATDLDSKFVGGVFVENVPDTLSSVKWDVTDSQGKAMGTLSSVTGTSVTWTVPSSPPRAYWIRMTVDDLAANGDAFDDKPVIITTYVTVGMPGPISTTITAAQAISAASTFCSSIGAAETGTAEAYYPALVDFDGAQPTYYAPRWEVKFESGTEVQVVDSASHVIARYTNFKETEDLLASGQPAGYAMEETDAISSAATARQATGSTDTIAVPTAALHQMTDPPLAAGQTWTVTWVREYTDALLGTIPYRDQAARAILQGESGGIQGISLGFPTVAPVPATNSLTQAAAQTIAEGPQGPLVSAGIDTPVLQSATRMVVQPNTYWTDGNSEPNGNAPVVAWNLIYADINDVTYEVWVSASGAGSVVGGVDWGIARGKAPAKRALKKAVSPKAVLKWPIAKAVAKTDAKKAKTTRTGNHVARRTHR